jgi:hypothetical protein
MQGQTERRPETPYRDYLAELAVNWYATSRGTLKSIVGFADRQRRSPDGSSLSHRWERPFPKLEDQAPAASTEAINDVLLDDQRSVHPLELDSADLYRSVFGELVDNGRIACRRSQLGRFVRGFNNFSLPSKED